LLYVVFVLEELSLITTEMGDNPPVMATCRLLSRFTQVNRVPDNTAAVEPFTDIVGVPLKLSDVELASVTDTNE
jgi:hypothetical protein